jgi:hypothetical protein
MQGGEKMGTVWAQRREEVLRDCLVSPDVFHQMVERLAEFVVPYQHVLETEAGQRNVYLYLQGLLSHLPGKNAEDIATLVDVERQVIQEFIGTAPWDHRPLIEVLVAQVADRLGQPDGIIAFDPSSFPKRGTHSVGVKRCRLVKDRIRLWKEGVRDLVMELCCALHNFRVRLTPWQPMA